MSLLLDKDQLKKWLTFIFSWPCGEKWREEFYPIMDSKRGSMGICPSCREYGYFDNEDFRRTILFLWDEGFGAESDVPKIECPDCRRRWDVCNFSNDLEWKCLCGKAGGMKADDGIKYLKIDEDDSEDVKREIDRVEDEISDAECEIGYYENIKEELEGELEDLLNAQKINRIWS